MLALRQHGLGVRGSFRPTLGRCEGLRLRGAGMPLSSPATSKITRRVFRAAFKQTRGPTATSHHLRVILQTESRCHTNHQSSSPEIDAVFPPVTIEA